MDRYITHLSPLKSPKEYNRCLNPLYSALDLGKPVLSPQSPTKVGSPLRKRLQISTVSEVRNIEPSISPSKQVEIESQAEKCRLQVKYMVDVPSLRDDFYSTLLAVCPVTDELAVGLKNEVRLWSGQSGVRIPSLPSQLGSVTCLDFSEGGVLVAGYLAGRVCMYDPTIDAMIATLTLKDGAYPTSIKFKGSYTVYAGDNKGQLHIISTFMYQSRKLMRAVKTVSASTDMISGLGFNQAKDQLICGSNDGSLTIWDTGSRKEHKLVLNSSIPHGSAVKAITCFPTCRNLMVTGGGRADRTLRVIDLNTKQVLQVLQLPAQVTGFAWLGNFDLFVALGHSRGGPVKMGQVYRFENGECRLLFEVIDKAQRAVYCVKTRDGVILGLNTKIMLFFHWKEGKEGNGIGLRKSTIMTTPLR